MGIYIRPSRFLKFRFTKRGVRVAVGPRALRYHFGAGGEGVSTGAGPVTLYEPIRRGRARKPAAGGRKPAEPQRPESWSQFAAERTAENRAEENPKLPWFLQPTVGAAIQKRRDSRSRD